MERKKKEEKKRKNRANGCVSKMKEMAEDRWRAQAGEKEKNNCTYVENRCAQGQPVAFKYKNITNPKKPLAVMA